MEIDKHISEKLKNRELKPSDSAWERLANQLDNIQQEKKKKKWKVYVSYAASITLLISSIIWISNEEKSTVLKEEYTISESIDTLLVKEKITNNIILVQEETKVSKQEIKMKEEALKDVVNSIKLKDFSEENVIAKVENMEALIDTSLVKRTKKEEKRKRIFVDSEALLYAVTHSSEETIAYYKKYGIDRNATLDTVRKQLLKSNLKIDASIILAEVEKDIEEDDFQKNFMQKFKLKLRGVLVAISDRNK